MIPSYHLDADVSDAEADFIENKLQQYNLTTSPPTQDPLRRFLRLALRDESGTIQGGVLGYMYRHCLFIDILWVDESCRGTGAGKALLLQAEAIARQWGATLVHLDTFSFQAPEFYQHCGYTVFGVLDGYRDGISRYYLKKNLQE